MSLKCSYKLNSSSDSSFSFGKSTGPDVNGDNENDQLSAVQLDVQYKGEPSDCKKLFETSFSPGLVSNVLWSNSGTFKATIFELQALSVKGMEQLGGRSWKEFIADDPFHINKPSLFLSNSSIVDIGEIAYSTEFEGDSEVAEKNDSKDEPNVQIKVNPDGSISVDSDYKHSTTYTRTERGNLKRSWVKVDDIINSQLKGAIEIPLAQGAVRIGTSIKIIYKSKMPEFIRKDYGSAIDGNVLHGTVINLSNILYENIDGKLNLLKGGVSLTVSPKGQTDILKSIEINSIDDEYTIELEK